MSDFNILSFSVLVIVWFFWIAHTKEQEKESKEAQMKIEKDRIDAEIKFGKKD